MKKTILFLFIIIMGLLISLSGIKHFFPYTAPSRFLEGKEPYFDIYLPALYGHICSSGLILVVGFLGFFEYIRTHWMAVHRNLGKVYVFLIIFVSAPCGLVMAWYATGGWLVQLCFLLLSGLWWWFTWQAWRFIKQGKVEQHRAFMLRSYSLALSAVTLRWYSFGVVYFWNLGGPDVYVWLAWASWVPNLLLVELFLFSEKRRVLLRSSQ